MRIFLAVAGILSILLGLGLYHLLVNSDDDYSGKLVFVSEEEYSDFKLAIGKPEVRIGEDLTILSSQPPIVVDFSVSVPRGYEFEYGVLLRVSRVDALIAAVVVSVFSFCSLSLFLLFGWRYVFYSVW